MSSRKLSVDELKLHQAALTANDKILQVKEAEKLVPDAGARTAAINFLLGTGMFKVMATAGGVTAFRVVAKNEIEIKKDMSPEEAMVLGHIQASGNEGIWTKHLKAKTELHQTVIDRCLKSLAQKQLVKSIKAVRHPTRKIYMLAHLEPSVELTGGPWYTDNELDAEFIKLLSSACLHYIRDRSFPKQNSKRLAQNQIRLYAIGAAPSYPSAQQIQHFLSKSKITETELGVEHVEMLLRVLELDGEIEKVPFHSASSSIANAWNPPSDSEAASSGSESDPSDDERSHSKKRKRGKIKESNDSESELEDRSKTKKRKKHSKRDEDSDDEGSTKSSKKRKRRKDRKKKHKRKSKKRQETSSDEESESSEEDDNRKSSSRSKSSKSSVVKRQKSASPDLRDEFSAIRQERAPCGRCPGPTNPQECVYFEDWFALGANSQKDTATAAVKVEV
ncbi:RNA polymerase Rpc34 subunit-domain-containing protein [Pisolithus sp. B1]|nr:RNA polymerase Rpc34 subunit-domain-containing protein [Pisolithus sp. B1]